jgi:hypothetical protein
MIKKKCTKCGEERELSEFYKAKRGLHGTRADCKYCIQEERRINVLKAKPLPMYQTHKVCYGCKECKPVEDFGFKNSMCRPCERDRSRTRKQEYKEYVAKNKDVLSKKAKEYNKRNSKKLLADAKIYRNKLAMFKPFGSQLLPSDNPTDVKGKLFVSCKKCGKSFRPTNMQCQNRIGASKTIKQGDKNFYCSDNCRNTCDIFKVKSVPKSRRTKAQNDRLCQRPVKQALLDLQCDEVGYHYCEICGDIIRVDLHHTQQLAEGGNEVNNAAGMMLECPRCHVKVHADC